MITRQSRVKGSVFGAALGDALGRPTEFMTMRQILNWYPTPEGWGSPGSLVTDDTMMMLAVGWAIGNGAKAQPAWAEARLREAFKSWYRQDQDGRAPGGTCMGSISRMIRERGKPWQHTTDVHSKGCGANMRVQPVGYLRRLDPEDRAGLAQLQAAMTHAHPTALAAADVTQQAIWLLCEDLVDLPDLVPALRTYAHSQRTVYRERWLGDLADYALGSRDHTYQRQWIAAGWDEMDAILQRVEKAPKVLRWSADPCRYTGAGWTAEEAIGTALYCATLYSDRPITGLRRAAATSGDSDSIACLAGSLLGAAWGESAWPLKWMERIEFRPALERIAGTRY